MNVERIVAMASSISHALRRLVARITARGGSNARRIKRCLAWADLLVLDSPPPFHQSWHSLKLCTSCNIKHVQFIQGNQ